MMSLLTSRLIAEYDVLTITLNAAKYRPRRLALTCQLVKQNEPNLSYIRWASLSPTAGAPASSVGTAAYFARRSESNAGKRLASKAAMTSGFHVTPAIASAA